MLVIDLKIGESVKIGAATVTLEEKSGKVARLSIEAGKDVPVRRVQSVSIADFARNGIAPVPV